VVPTQQGSTRAAWEGWESIPEMRVVLVENFDSFAYDLVRGRPGAD
jgi:hypothetical protein